MKEKLLGGVIVVSVVALTALNLDMGVGSRWFNSVSLSAIEGMADSEADAVKDGQGWNLICVGNLSHLILKRL